MIIAMAQPLHHIEETLSHQERQIQDLSDMVARQWREIDQLKKTLLTLEKRMISFTQDAREVRATEDLSVAEQALRDKPPHY